MDQQTTRISVYVAPLACLLKISGRRAVHKMDSENTFQLTNIHLCIKKEGSILSL
jgi:hypothetical protein